ncbi:MAG: hypothetical protein N2545_08000 [Thermoflexales bacterium]|nr:hypothetical protein [Thermoflexales bacterium]
MLTDNIIYALLEWAKEWQVTAIAAGVVVNALLGVALSIKRSEFYLPRVFEWLWVDIVPLVLTYLTLKLFATWIELPIAADVVFAAIMSNLVARIADKALELGLPSE